MLSDVDDIPKPTDSELIRNKEVTESYLELDKLLTQCVNDKKLTFLEIDAVMSMLKYKIWSFYLKGTVDIAIKGEIEKYTADGNANNGLYS